MNPSNSVNLSIDSALQKAKTLNINFADVMRNLTSNQEKSFSSIELQKTKEAIDSNIAFVNQILQLSSKALPNSEHLIQHHASLALLLAIESRLNQEAANLAKNFLKKNTNQFVKLDGVYALRSEIEPITHGTLPKSPEEIERRQRQIDNLNQVLGLIRNGNTANVHLDGLVSNTAIKLQQLSILECNQRGRTWDNHHQIYDFLKSVINEYSDNINAIHALEQLKQRDGFVIEGDLTTNISEAVRYIANYYLSLKEDSAKNNFINALIGQLNDINHESPCNIGCVQRLLQVFEDIDPCFFSQEPNSDAIENEVSYSVALLNEKLDEIIKKDLEAQTANQATSSTIQHSVEHIIQYKQSMIKAFIDQNFVKLRGLHYQAVLSPMLKSLDFIEFNELFMNNLGLGDLAIDYQNHLGDSALTRAWLQNDLNAVIQLINKGASVLEIVKHYQNPFISGIQHNNLELIKVLLLDKDSKFLLDSSPNAANLTPLLYAASFGHTEIIKEFIKFGVNINQTNQYGQTALMLSCIANKPETAIFLLKNNAKFDHSSAFGDTALLNAAFSGISDVVDILIDQGANVNIANITGLTPLIAVARNGNLKIAQTLIKYGAVVNCSDIYNATPLKVAINNNNHEMVKLLIKENADVNYSGPTEKPIILASKLGNAEIIKTLIINGANSNQIDDDITKNCALHFAIFNGHITAAKQLIALNADINLQNINGYSPLMLASELGQLEIVNYLLEKGANTDLVNITNNTALTLACDKGHFDIVYCLLKKGINVNIQNVNHQSAMALAIENYHAEIVKILLEHGADINQRDANNNTPLMLAVYNNDAESIIYLLNHKANTTLTNNAGETAKSIAQRAGQDDVVALLKMYEN